MKNIIEIVKKDLRTYVKHNKKIMFSVSFLISFFMTGNIVLADEITNSKNNIEKTINIINNNISVLKRSNDKLIKSRMLELFQLEEQGDQVIKSPWESWQYGIGYTFGEMDTVKGYGDKKREYGENNIYIRGTWWEKNTNPTAPKYGLVQIGTDEESSVNSIRNGYQLRKLSITDLNKIKDTGVSLDIIASINPKTISREPGVISPSPSIIKVNPNIPTINVISFSPIKPSVNIKTPIDPPPLDDLSTGFNQGVTLGPAPERNVALGNASADTGIDTATIVIKDNKTDLIGSFSYDARNDTGVKRGIADSNLANYQVILVNSHQTFLNVLASSSTLQGKWVFKNETKNPKNNLDVFTNTVRFVSVNHASASFDKNIIFNLDKDANVEIYGRALDDTLTMSNNKNHMTVGIEQQSYASLASEAINSGKITFLPVLPGKDTSHNIGMATMIERYSKELVTSGVIGKWTPWESTLINDGIITFEKNVVNSIGVDFSEFSFNKIASGEASYNSKGSLNVYVETGNVVLNGSESYGLRVPNTFAPGITSKNPDTNAIYYDETIINGKKETGKEGIQVNGNNNVGVSISKIISMFRTSSSSSPLNELQTTKVYDYQTSSVGRANGQIDSTGRDSNDLIGNIYNLNISVDGKDNVGFLRKSDYMNGNNYALTEKLRAQNDFNIKLGSKTGHIETIDFTDNATGGTLIRTDKYGINLASGNTLTVTAMKDSIYGLTSATHPNNNIVMLSNETQSTPVSTRTAVRNLGTINLGTFFQQGNALVGLMSYNGGLAENKSTININSKNSVGIASVWRSSTNKGDGTNAGNINILGDNSVGIYNEGLFNMDMGTIDSKGKNTIGVYTQNNNPTNISVTNINSGTLLASNVGIGMFADEGTTINLGDMNSANPSLQLVSNSGGLFFFTKMSTTPGKYSLKEDVSLNINNDGIGFHGEDLSTFNPNTYFATFFQSAGGKLNITTANDNSTLFYIDGSSAPVNLSTLPSINTSTLPSQISFDGTLGYRIYKAGKITLHIDKNFALEDLNEVYNRSEFLSSKIYIDSGYSITTSQSNKAAFAQKNVVGGLQSDILVENNGQIDISGSNSAGIVTDFGLLTNNGTLSVNGLGSAGMIGVNETLTKNIGTIKLGDGSIGIL